MGVDLRGLKLSYGVVSVSGGDSDVNSYSYKRNSLPSGYFAPVNSKLGIQD
jgi:hypothetical protein